MSSNKIFIQDKRVGCLSGLGILNVENYLDLVSDVYKDNGGISGQRAVLKTKTGITIRKRMISDIQNGAVLPPIVLGAVVDEATFDIARQCSSQEEFLEIIKRIDKPSISIIDGMQRTNALDVAIKDSKNYCDIIRVDFWLAKNIESLIYRMLVLNTGQVPWDIKRQLETIYKQVLLKIKKEIGDIDVFDIDEKERRSSAGQYRATRIVELFLAFTSRKPHIELKEKVAEDFARMDATEATSNEKAIPVFIETMKLLASLDRAFSTTTINDDYISEDSRFKEGKDIFTSAPASIGFSAAAAQYLLGMPGYDFDFDNVDEKLRTLKLNITTICEKIASSQNNDFIDYLTLNEKVNARSGRIGEYERELFFRAYTHMFNYADTLKNLTPCWVAYK